MSVLSPLAKACGLEKFPGEQPIGCWREPRLNLITGLFVCQFVRPDNDCIIVLLAAADLNYKRRLPFASQMPELDAIIQLQAATQEKLINISSSSSSHAALPRRRAACDYLSNSMIVQSERDAHRLKCDFPFVALQHVAAE